MKTDKLQKGFWITGDILGIIIGIVSILGLTLDLSGFGQYTRLVTVTEGKAPQKISQPVQKNNIVKPVNITNPEFPRYIRIPVIKLSAIIEHIGLTRDGAIGVPKGQNNAAWYNEGARPGDIGSAIISGHYGVWKNGKPAVFNNLSKLRRGDKIYIEDKDGTEITFIVRESKKYLPTAAAIDVFDANDGASHLNIITCEGVWNALSKSYSSRLVIFADKEVK